MNEKRLENLRKLHDEIKEHPFWKTMDIGFHADCVDSLKGLLNTFIGGFCGDEREKNPHFVLLYPIMHGLFSSILSAKIMYRQMHKNITDTPAFGNYVLCLQTALQIVHCYLDGIFDEDEIVSYEPHLHFNKEEDTYDECTYKTYAVRKNDDDTYRVVRVITKDEIPEVMNFHTKAVEGYCDVVKKYGEKQHPTSFDVEYANKCLKRAEYHKGCVDDLKDNKQLYFIIK